MTWNKSSIMFCILYIFIYTCVCVCVCVYVCVYIHIYMCVCIYTLINIYKYIYITLYHMHTYIFTYVHIFDEQERHKQHQQGIPSTILKNPIDDYKAYIAKKKKANIIPFFVYCQRKENHIFSTTVGLLSLFFLLRT